MATLADQDGYPAIVITEEDEVNPSQRLLEVICLKAKGNPPKKVKVGSVLPFYSEQDREDFLRKLQLQLEIQKICQVARQETL